jgi:D-amino-acid dehydrogenase
MSTEQGDVVVIGGGLVGLTLAYELAELGAEVVLIDAGLPGRATAAGAGILSPDTTAVDDDAWWDFSQGAGAHYPMLLQRLAGDGIDTSGTGYGRCGLLSLGLRPHEDSWFAPFAEIVMRRSAGRVAEISPAEAVDRFPPLGLVDRALYNDTACRVDGRGMAAALREAAQVKGVRVLHDRVTGLRSEGSSVRSLVLEAGAEVICGAVAIAGGAWSAAMGEWLDVSLPITPTKGQIVHLTAGSATESWPIAQPLLTHYLVPWPGGRVACGGTFEAGAGYSPSATAAGRHELLRECLLVAPGLADAQYLETRVGLRPITPDDRPVIGALPGWTNAWVATGHGASGLLLGPYSSHLLAHLIMQGDPAASDERLPAAVAPGRFS